MPVRSLTLEPQHAGAIGTGQRDKPVPGWLMSAEGKWCVACLVSWQPYVSSSVANGFEAVLGRPLASPPLRESGSGNAGICDPLCAILAWRS